MMLDKSRPYATVHGISEAKYRQDGRYFDGSGKPLDKKDEIIPEIKPDYASMHWKQLEKLVRDNGGEYRSKEQAVEFMEAL
jgi:hypothetical protein